MPIFRTTLVVVSIFLAVLYVDDACHSDRGSMPVSVNEILARRWPEPDEFRATTAAVSATAANVTPAAAAEAWEASVAGDYARAERACEIVGLYEDLTAVARGGSAEAASYASMKSILREWGIIANSGLTRPLRGFSDEEVADLRTKLSTLPHGAKRVAVAA